MFLSVNQKKIAQDTTTPEQELFKLSEDNNGGDLGRMAPASFKGQIKNILSLFESVSLYD